MRKKLLLLVIISSLFILISCKKEIDKHGIVFNELEIEFTSSEENLNNIKNDISLPLTSNKYPEAYIYWDSTDFDVIEINNDIGIVKRDIVDHEISLYVFITIDDLKEMYEIKVKVLKEEQATNTHALKYVVNKKTYEVIEIEIGEEIVFPKNPYLKNQIFIGWSYNNELIDETLEVTKNITLTAVFNKQSLHESYELDSSYYEGEDGLSQIEITTIEELADFSVLINDILYEDYEVVNNKLIYANINIKGSYTLELIGFNESSVKVFNNTNETNIEADINDLAIKLEYFKETKVKFIKKGVRGTNFTYTPSDSLIDIDNNIIYIEDDIKVVSLVIEGTILESLVSVELELTLGVTKLRTISEAKLLDNDSIVNIEAIVTGYYLEKKATFVYTKDETGTILLVFEEAVNIAQGDLINVFGNIEDNVIKVDEYKIVKNNQKYSYDLLLNYNDLEESLHNYIYIEGTVTSNLVNKRFDIYLDKKIAVLLKTNQYKLIEQKTYISFYGYVDKIDDEYVIIVTNLKDISSTKLNDTVVVNLIMNSLMLNELFTYPVNRDFIVPKNDPMFNSEIIFESNSEYLSNEGIYTKPDETIESTIKLSFKLEGKIIGERIIKVKIMK